MADKILVDYINQNRDKFSIEALKEKILESGKSEQDFQESLEEINRLEEVKPLEEDKPITSKKVLLYSSFAGFALFLLLGAYFFVPLINESVNGGVIFFLSVILLLVFFQGFNWMGKTFNKPLLKKSFYWVFISLILLCLLFVVFYFFLDSLIVSLAADDLSRVFLEGVTSYSGEGIFDLSQFSSETYSTFLRRETIHFDVPLLTGGIIALSSLSLFVFLGSFFLIGLGLWQIKDKLPFSKVAPSSHLVFSLGMLIFSSYLFYKFLSVLLNPRATISFLTSLDSLFASTSLLLILVKCVFLLVLVTESYLFFSLWRK